MKKNNILLIVAISVVLIVVIAIIGRDFFFPPKAVRVTGVEFSYTDDFVEVDINGNLIGSRQLEWKVLPENATNKNVSFTATNGIVVSNTGDNKGTVTLNDFIAGMVTITTEDGMKTDSIGIFPNQTAAYALEYDFSTNTLSNTANKKVIKLFEDVITSETEITFYEGSMLSFGTGISVIVDAADAEYAEFSDGVLKLLKSTENQIIELIIKNAAGETNILKIKIADLTILTLSSTLSSFGTNPANFMINQDSYYVGTKNNYDFNYTIRKKTGILETAEVIYDIYNMSTSQLIETVEFSTANETKTVNNYLTFVDYNTIKFNEGLADDTKIRIEVAYKYNDSASDGFTFTINGGFNIASVADLYTYFVEQPQGENNPTTFAINYTAKNPNAIFNFVSNIEIKLSDIPSYLLNAEGRIKLKDPYTNSSHQISLFPRISGCTINGNLHIVDAGDIPLTEKEMSSDNPNIEKGDYGSVSAVFNFGVREYFQRNSSNYDDSNDPSGIPDSEKLYWQEMYRDAPKHVINNLQIKSNGGKEISTGEGENKEYIGFQTSSAIKTNYSKTKINNCILEDAMCGIDVIRQNFVLEVKNTRISNTAGSNISVSKGLTLAIFENLDLGNAGFAAIYFTNFNGDSLVNEYSSGGTPTFKEIFALDSEYSSYELDFKHNKVVFKGNLKCENWVTGGEAYMGLLDNGAYAQTALLLKGSIYENSGTEIFNLLKKDPTDPNSVDKLRFNFVYVNESFEQPTQVLHSYKDLNNYNQYRNAPAVQEYSFPGGEYMSDWAFMAQLSQDASIIGQYDAVDTMLGTSGGVFAAGRLTTVADANNTALYAAFVDASHFISGAPSALSYIIMGVDQIPGANN